ncbi:hypothetical protein H9I45_05535 [Polaribacter haliotis]|uniref:Tail specific protease domain-containing protein n=1 Tax=Polaribacter haliotis TaxID=1888915 RepID=A0A7L8AIS6_9FLAO|nr:S41 family peptidase [Polaribacter haliotis]QOD61903.1 hypothetical protein H9I45_05535 [Polaribacter haliotis]
MKNFLTPLFLFLSFANFAQTQNSVDAYKLNQDFGNIIQSLADNYIYLKDKKTDFDCVKDKYANVVGNVKTNQERVLFFEYLLNEFYDTNLLLNTTTKSSFRLHSPLHIVLKEGKFYVQNIWYSQIKDFGKNIIGAEVLNFNSKEFNKVIDDFPTQCANKNLPEVREWIANKIISGRLNESRILTLKLTDDRKISLDVDNIKIKEDKKLLTVRKENGIAIIKINNSLGNNKLIKRFDRQLNTLLNTKGLILDLRNTVDGENDYVARAIMSRFIDKDLPYQKNITKEKYGNNPEVNRSRLEFVSPRGTQYNKPVVVLVGRWTGSTGENLAVGLDGMERAKIVGSEMGKLVGSTIDYSFENRKYGYRIPTQKLYHVNGILKENFVPEFNIIQQSTLVDDVLVKAFNLFELKDLNNFDSKDVTTNNIIAKTDKKP